MIPYLTISCSKATELIERRTRGDLRLLDRWRLSLHLRICVWCQQYERQSQALEGWLERSAKLPHDRP